MSRSLMFIVLLWISLMATSGSASAQGLLRLSSAKSEPGASMATESEARLQLSKFERIPGQSTVMASVFNRAVSGKANGKIGSSSFVDSEPLANYLFMDLTTDETYRLLPTDNWRIVSLIRITRQDQLEADFAKAESKLEFASQHRSAAIALEDSAVLWHVVSFAMEDTNSDKVINSRDGRSLAIADGNGRRLTPLLKDAGIIETTVMLNSEVLHIIHGSATAKYATRIHLPERRIISQVRIDLEPKP